MEIMLCYVTIKIKIMMYFVCIIMWCLFAETNERDSNLCLNGGTCTDAVNKYSCSCASGYAGINCETGMFLIVTLSWKCHGMLLYGKIRQYYLSMCVL